MRKTFYYDEDIIAWSQEYRFTVIFHDFWNFTLQMLQANSKSGCAIYALVVALSNHVVYFVLFSLGQRAYLLTIFHQGVHMLTCIRVNAIIIRSQIP